MSSNYYFLNNKNKNRLSGFLLACFSIVSCIEIIAEYNEDKLFIWYTKPLIIPLLFGYYFISSKKINNYFIAALAFSWIANILFIENTILWIIYGSIFFLIYRILIIYIVMNKVKMPSLVPSIIGSVPFIFIYATVVSLTFNAMGNNIYIFLLHGLFTIFLGGLSLGNYIMSPNKPNFYLFISTMLFAITQFVFVLKVYYEEANLFHAIAMILFVLGQFLLVKFMFLTEKYNHRYEIINNFSDHDRSKSDID